MKTIEVQLIFWSIVCCFNHLIQLRQALHSSEVHCQLVLVCLLSVSRMSNSFQHCVFCLCLPSDCLGREGSSREAADFSHQLFWGNPIAFPDFAFLSFRSLPKPHARRWGLEHGLTGEPGPPAHLCLYHNGPVQCPQDCKCCPNLSLT